MKRKSVSALFLTVVLSMSMVLGGCGDNADQQKASQGSETAKVSSASESTSENTSEASGEVQMWNGYYQDTSTGLLSFVHFNEDGSYYAKYFDGGVMEAGSYQVLDEEMEYYVDGGADEDYATEEDNTKATAPQVVELTSYKTGEAVRVAYDKDQLCDMSLGGMANHRTLIHDAEYAYNPDTDETAIELFVFYAGSSMGSNFILSHNKTFTDVTGDAFQDGSWEMKEAGVYALTYSDGTEATLTVEADGKNAVLAKDGGEELALRDTFEESGDTSGTVVQTLTAEDAQVGLPMGVNLRIDIYSDNTCKLIVEVAQVGAELEADQGTCSLDEASFKYTFQFEKAGELTSEPDYSTANAQGLDMALAYKADVEVDFNDAVTPLSIDSVLEGRIMNNDFTKEVAEIETKYPANNRSGEIVFYGASNFRLWTEMENDLSDYKVQNHGFGGSTDELLVKYAERILYPYNPQIVVFQTGSNDYENIDGTDDEIVKACIEYKRQMFAEFHEKLPEAEFIVMSGLLLPGRSEYTALTQDLNFELKKLCEEFDYMHFVDASDMTFDGKKYAEDLFTDDLIHLNHEGQLRWCEEFIRPALEQVVEEKKLEDLKK